MYCTIIVPWRNCNQDLVEKLGIRGFFDFIRKIELPIEEGVLKGDMHLKLRAGNQDVKLYVSEITWEEKSSSYILVAGTIFDINSYPDLYQSFASDPEWELKSPAISIQ